MDPSYHAASAYASMQLLRKDGTQIGHRSIIIQWQNGKKEIVWPQKMRTARPVFP